MRALITCISDVPRHDSARFLVLRSCLPHIRLRPAHPVYPARLRVHHGPLSMASWKSGSGSPAFYLALCRMLILDKGAVMLDLLVVHEIGIAIDRPAPDIGCAKKLQPFGRGFRFQLIACLGKDFIAARPVSTSSFMVRKLSSPITSPSVFSFGKATIIKPSEVAKAP